MFALHNLALLFKKLSNKEFKNLEKLWKKDRNSTKEDIIQFAATAHHKPKNAIDSARRWLDN